MLALMGRSYGYLGSATIDERNNTFAMKYPRSVKLNEEDLWPPVLVYFTKTDFNKKKKTKTDVR